LLRRGHAARRTRGRSSGRLHGPGHGTLRSQHAEGIAESLLGSAVGLRLLQLLPLLATLHVAGADRA
jgi:hypothetical protein